jgi:putative ABC transport system permease protein
MNDLRFAFRQFAKSPGFVAVAVLTLALGIGANTAIFSVLNTLLLKPLPYPEADRLVQIAEQPTTGGFAASDGGVFSDWEHQTTQLESIAAIHPVSKNLAGNGDPVRLNGAEVSAQFLRVLRVKPFLGRDFAPDEDAPGGNRHVLILTHELWASRFQADPGVIGRAVQIDAESFTVIGVLPPRALLNPNVGFLAPATIRADAYKLVPNYNYVCNVIGRLKPGATMEHVAAELQAARRSVVGQYPSFRQAWTVSARSLQEATYGNTRPFVLTLLAAVGAVLLIACANVGNLLLARASTRQGEMAVRVALGASTGRLLRQLMTESMLLAAAGGAAGLLLGACAIHPLIVFTRLNVNAPGLEVTIDGRVLAFTLAATALTGVLFGLFPALAAARPNLNDSLKEMVRGSTSAGRRRLQSLLIVAESALTVVLLVCAGLLVRSFLSAFAADPGFAREQVLVFNYTQPASKAPTVDHRLRFAREVQRRIAQLPGVAHVGLASSTPMNGQIGFGDFVSREDRPATRNDLNAGFDSADGQFFQALGVPLFRGRFFTEADSVENAPRVMIINAALARQLFPNEDALGRLLHFKDATWEIVGVVGNVRQFRLDIDPFPHLFLPLRHFPWYTTVVVHARGAPPGLADDLRRAVQSVDSEQPIANLTTLAQVADASLQNRRILLTLVGLFAAVALLLAAIGIYGVMAYSVAQRTREIGIRIALGASVPHVIGLVLRDGLQLVALGIGIGAVASYGAARLIASQLYSTSQTDPLVLLLVAVVLVAVALFACWLPARKATRVDPVTALRAE